MEKENIPGLMVEDTKEILKMIKDMAMGNLFYQMDHLMQENGLMVSEMVEDYKLLLIIKQERESGRMVD
jgi:hydroxypyruvate isomerase